MEIEIDIRYAFGTGATGAIFREMTALQKRESKRP